MRHLLLLSLKSWRNRRGTVALSITAIVVSVALVVGVQYVRDQAHRSFMQTVAGTDLIVGARSGPVNLLLYAVFHIGNATSDLSWQSYRAIAAHPQVAWAVPVALGDSHRGFRVVGTTPDYFAHFRYGEGAPLRFAEGQSFTDTAGAGRFAAVLGSAVARELGYAVGTPLTIAHGLSDTAFARHSGHAFEVAGVLAPTGTPVDRTVVVSLAGLQAIHGAAGHGHGSAEPTAVTALYVGLRNRVATFRLQRDINTYTGEPLLAILPGVALAELWQIIAPVERMLQAIAGCVALAGLIGLLITLLSTLGERRREMAVLRAVGAGPRHILFLFVFEAFWIVLLGVAGGVALLYGVIAVARPAVEAAVGIHLPLRLPGAIEWLLLGSLVAAGTLLGLVPGWLAMRRSLADGLTVRL